MKTKLYILIGIALLLTSCRSIEKMVDEGRYKEAFTYGADQLVGKKKIKRQHVMAFEEAYAKLIDRELREINVLEQRGGRNWETAFRKYNEVRYFQDVARRLDPLVSKDGYVANFKYINVSKKQSNAADAAYGYLEKLANSEIIYAREGQKTNARRAYSILDKMDSYRARTSEVYDLMREMKKLGTEYVAVDLTSEDDFFDPALMLEGLMLKNLGNFWTDVELFDYQKEYDYILVANLLNLDAGINSEREKSSWLEKEISKGFEYELDRKGNKVLDHKGDTIRVEKLELVRAEVTEYSRRKSGEMVVGIHLFDQGSLNKVEEEVIRECYVFEDWAISYYGDKRALDTRCMNRVNHRISRFPNDRVVLDQLRGKMSSRLKSKITNMLGRIV